ncbi:hypothetical protein DFH11DRAFT_1828708 [Phellopilus nigrolimitatus]|nr:hypothetical protein DFH11DRAFT_1828708 [Phellopilus nigrolimitatus]
MPYFSSVRAEGSAAPADGDKRSPDDEGDLLSPLPMFTKRAPIPEQPRDSFVLSKRNDFSSSSSLPSTPLPPLLPSTLLAAAESSHSSKSRKKRGARIQQGLHVHWARFLRKIGSGDEVQEESVVAGSTTTERASSVREPRPAEADFQEEEDTSEEKGVDEVVVDRSWGRIGIGSEPTTYEEDTDRTGGDRHASGNGETTVSGSQETPFARPEGFWSPVPPADGRALPAVARGGRVLLADVQQQAKPLALWSSLFFVLNWVLGCALVPKPFTLADNIFYFGVAPVLTLPIPFFVIFDFPRLRPNLYHTLLAFSTWCWSIFQILYIFLCGFYTGEGRQLACDGGQFLSLFYYTSALQTIALFGLKQNRFPAMIGAGVFLVMSASMVIPHQIDWIRNEINFIIFQSFLLYIHYMKEMGERRLYVVRDQLKVQFKATQKAQINERKASESKRRLTSNRMDSGRLESVAMPYSFHETMRGLLVPLELATKARNLQLVEELDESIDILGAPQWESLSAQNRLDVQDGGATFEKHWEARPDEYGVVVGDEMRLRQIVTNLTSNACKFTPAGGTLTVRTRLVVPAAPERLAARAKDASARRALENGDLESGECAGLSARSLDQHNAAQRKGAALDRIVVRIEVSDTGYGIRARDMEKGKLFSAFNQTEQGRLQGGKGTGLGLALVRQIVSLSGGRLGIQSKKAVSGTGSTASEHDGSSTLLSRKTSATRVQVKQITAPQLLRGPGSTAQNSDASVSETVVGGSSRSSYTHASRTSSALKGIMEQGGAVELSPAGLAVGGRIPTRTIGDPSTGTDTSAYGPPSPQESDPQPVGNGSPSSPSPFGRPSFVELPKRPTFNSSGGSASTESSGGKSASPRADASDSPIRVLVVDDDQLTRRLMKRMLQRLGCTVSTAENGQIAYDLLTGEGRTPLSETAEGPQSPLVSGTPPALESAGQRDYDGPRYEVVFLDNQMPVLSGLDLVAKLRQLGRTDFIVGVTGNALLSDQEEYQEAGVDYVITKPVFEVSLKGMLGIAAERRKNGAAPRPSSPVL